mmetsp:Transcript_56515/g.126263  ORF Transcript_56515/g.126263 Transcript_56515/m.126263 type:complete len:214 (+) Transcript_56515:479-1120(+)
MMWLGRSLRPQTRRVSKYGRQSTRIAHGIIHTCTRSERAPSLFSASSRILISNLSICSSSLIPVRTVISYHPSLSQKPSHTVQSPSDLSSHPNPPCPIPCVPFHLIPSPHPTHQGSAVSGVFYVAMPPCAGGIHFRDPRGITTAFGAENTWISHTPRAGELLLFPPWLEHYVAPSCHSKAPRISLSFNLMSMNRPSGGQWEILSDASVMMNGD